MKSTKNNDYFIEYLFRVFVSVINNIKLSYETYMNNMKINSKWLLNKNIKIN